MGALQMWAVNVPAGGGAIPWGSARLIFDSRPSVLDVSRQVLSPVLDEALNTVPSVRFTIPQGSDLAGWIMPRRTWLKIVETDQLGTLFVGRAVMIDQADPAGTPIVAEGDLAVFSDTLCPVFDLSDTPTNVIGWLVGAHNAQVDVSRQLGVGQVDNDLDPNMLIQRSNAQSPLPSMWEILARSTFDSTAGGYLYVSGQPGSRLLNWVKTPGPTSPQILTVDQSLTHFVRSTSSAGMLTAVEPFGARLDETDMDSPRLTVGPNTPGAKLLFTDPDGSQHWGAVDTEAEAIYGRVLGSGTWDDVHVDVNLLARAGAMVAAAKGLEITFDAEAIDQHLVDPAITRLAPGQQVTVKIPALGVNQKLLCQGKTTRLDTGDGWVVRLGAVTRSLTDILAQANRTAGQIQELVSSNARIGETVGDTRQQLTQSVLMLSSLIEQSADQIATMVASNFVTTDGLDTLAQQLSSLITQTATNVDFLFSQSTEQTQLVNSALQTTRQELQTMIRLTAAGVEVGRTANPVKTLVSPDGMSITVNGVEVAYFKSDEQLIDRARFLTSFRVGGFITEPDPKGGLWERWIGV